MWTAFVVVKEHLKKKVFCVSLSNSRYNPLLYFDSTASFFIPEWWFLTEPTGRYAARWQQQVYLSRQVVPVSLPVAITKHHCIYSQLANVCKLFLQGVKEKEFKLFMKSRPNMFLSFYRHTHLLLPHTVQSTICNILSRCVNIFSFFKYNYCVNWFSKL